MSAETSPLDVALDLVSVAEEEIERHVHTLHLVAMGDLTDVQRQAAKTLSLEHLRQVRYARELLRAVQLAPSPSRLAEFCRACDRQVTACACSQSSQTPGGARLCTGNPLTGGASEPVDAPAPGGAAMDFVTRAERGQLVREAIEAMGETCEPEDTWADVIEGIGGLVKTCDELNVNALNAVAAQRAAESERDALRAAVERLRAACSYVAHEIDQQHDYAPDVGESPCSGAGEWLTRLRAALGEGEVSRG